MDALRACAGQLPTSSSSLSSSGQLLGTTWWPARAGIQAGEPWPAQRGALQRTGADIGGRVRWSP